ncbi:UPF0182 family protein, partial [Chroococcidiopsidales cyanobacterium LEGE 13417]|nr:UPF0182 family protein [Chroococcidiopsidales cyanobacterium LEGE 13417]
MLKKPIFLQRCFQLIAIVFGLWLFFDLVARLGAEIFWFQEVGHLPVLRLRLLTQGLLWAIGFGITALYLLGNLVVAERLIESRGKRAEGAEEAEGAEGAIPSRKSLFRSRKPRTPHPTPPVS